MPTPEEIIRQGEEEVRRAEEAPEEVGFEEEEAEEAEEHDDEPRAVSSTMVAEWGYERESETLEVTFNNGNTESYPCTPEQWEEAKEAASAGVWMHENMLGR